MQWTILLVQVQLLILCPSNNKSLEFGRWIDAVHLPSYYMKRTPLKPKKFYTLKKSPLKAKKNYQLKKTELKVSDDYELKKQKW